MTHRPMEADDRDGKQWDRNALVRLRRILVAHFDEEELRTLCFDLQIDYDSLPAQGTAGKACALVAYCQRHDCIAHLIAKGSSTHPHVSWETHPSRVFPSRVVPPRSAQGEMKLIVESVQSGYQTTLSVPPKARIGYVRQEMITHIGLQERVEIGPYSALIINWVLVGDAWWHLADITTAPPIADPHTVIGLFSSEPLRDATVTLEALGITDGTILGVYDILIVSHLPVGLTVEN